MVIITNHDIVLMSCGKAFEYTVTLERTRTHIDF